MRSFIIHCYFENQNISKNLEKYVFCEYFIYKLNVDVYE